MEHFLLSHTKRFCLELPRPTSILSTLVIASAVAHSAPQGGANNNPVCSCEYGTIQAASADTSLPVATNLQSFMCSAQDGAILTAAQVAARNAVESLKGFLTSQELSLSNTHRQGYINLELRLLHHESSLTQDLA